MHDSDMAALKRKLDRLGLPTTDAFVELMADFDRVCRQSFNFGVACGVISTLASALINFWLFAR